jgi:type I restriction enzyme S subunit
LIFLKSPHFIETGIPLMTGTAGQKRVATEYFANSPFPLPPLAEQRRIVAKVDELMALCDLLEAAQAERESRRERLVRASLHRLNQPADGPAFRDDARFTLDHLPLLTARPEHVPQLRQTILNLAVRGKLVAQDPKDEPAAELLKRIRTGKERMAMARNGNKRTPSSIASDRDELFEIPASWRWVSLGEIAFGFRYGTSMKCGYEPEGEPVLRIPNIDNGRINVEDLKFGPLPAREAADLRLELGDILMVRSNGSLNLVGRPALVESNAVGFCYAGYLVRVRTARDLLDSRYLVLALSTEHVREQIEIPIRTAVGLKNVNATELSGLMLPLASLAEQRRIVAKVDELMALCDRLEMQLTTCQTEGRRLLESVLHEALAFPRT